MSDDRPANNEVLGIHHVTAIASDPQRNLDFYTRVLGLRLVKRTVNYDDPGSYHFYFGDEAGTPGTLLTFFPWPGAPRGRPGPGQVAREPTPVIDRKYFESVYFREPGGILLELATDPPGFAVDEQPDRLGERLMLPERYERQRAQIEAVLPPIELPVSEAAEGLI
jgi:glyoxalase family protein